MNVKERIQALSKTKNLSLPKIEKALHLGAGTISKWDKSVPSYENLSKVANLLDTTAEYLKTGEKGDVAQNETERRLLLLCRRAENATAEDKEAIVNQFESTIDIYLRAKGIKE